MSTQSSSVGRPDGVLEVDRRAFVYYMALGNSPAMMSKNIGVGSYYLWTYKDASGGFLDGAQNYKLRIPANVPAKDFWSVLVMTRSADPSCSEPFPSVSKYSDPKLNADSSVDVYFGPTMPQGQEKNWIKTVAGKGWFPIFRFYGPLEPLYDKSFLRGPRIIAVAGNLGDLWGEQHRVETRTKPNHS
jgi:hypothetical protein